MHGIKLSTALPATVALLLLPLWAAAGDPVSVEQSEAPKDAAVEPEVQKEKETQATGPGFPGHRGTGGSDYPQHRQYSDPLLAETSPQRTARPVPPPPAGANPRSALLHAAAFGDLDETRTLLESGASPNARSKDKRGRTALILAALGGHVDVINALIEKGARLEDKDKTGHTALSWAAMRGQAAAARVLLQHGANVNTQSFALVSPLLYAVGTQNQQIVALLAEAGADLDFETRDNKMTPLLLAIEHRNLDISKLLIGSGADVNKRNQDSYSPLMAAAEKADVEIARLLIAEGAQVNVKDNKGQTALTLARESGDDSVVKTLLDAGAET